MRELTFEEMNEVAGGGGGVGIGGIILGWAVGKVIDLAWEYRMEIMGVIAYCTTQRLLAEQAHYEMLYYSTRS